MTTNEKNAMTAAIAVCVIGLLILLVALKVGAQQPKPDPKPFNAKASQRWQQLEKMREDIIREANRQPGEIANQQKAMREVADIPEDWQCKADDKGIVVCARPEAAKVVSPEKK